MKLSVKLFVQAGQIHFQLLLTPSSLHKTRRGKKKEGGTHSDYWSHRLNPAMTEDVHVLKAG